MPIGGRNPTPETSTIISGAPPAGGPGWSMPGAGGPLGATVEWLWRTQAAQVADLSDVVGGPLTGPLAVFPAPPSGQFYIYERLTIVTGSPTASILMGTGNVTAANMLDLYNPVVAPFLSLADGASAPRLPAGDQLWIAWVLPTSTPLRAMAQIRVEAA